MTVLTGDFDIDASVAGLPAGVACALGGAAGLAGDSSRDAADTRLYLRHVEGGETIRALAREAGCHASTILRRIRRIESRRDDPLLDRALERAGCDGGDDGRFSRSEVEQFRRILRRLAESGAVMVLAEGMEKAIVVRDDIRTAILDRRIAEKIALHGWVAMQSSGRIIRYAISSTGREALKKMIAARRGGMMPRDSDFATAMPVGGQGSAGDGTAFASGSEPTPGMAEAAAPFDHADRHRIWDDRDITDPEDGTRRRTRVNIAESPLQILARRREADGRPFLTPGMVAAGERLREDFELAQIGPRVTQNWDRFLTAGAESRHSGGGFGGGSDSARNRVGAALRELGPGMGDLCLRVCCFLEGIEMTERRLGWSARSGKIVLRLALMRLERHYEEAYGKGLPLIG